MSLSRRFCRLRPSATPLPRAQSRPSFISSAVARRAYASSKPSASPSDVPSSSNTSATAEPSSTDDQDSPAEPPQLGSLAKTSIFEQEAQRIKDQDQDTQFFDNPSFSSRSQPSFLLESRNPVSMAAVLDPKPSARIGFERRMIIQEVRKRGRLTKEQHLKCTERQYVKQSEFHKTGMKKVAPLARQIAGKTIDDAIVQMRFSKKKAATWILQHLEATRDQATVERGMGLGAVGAQGKAQPGELKIELKDGSRHKVKDQTSMYIDQAWVNKGPYGRAQSKRARGKIHMLKLPQTAITLQLKEEKTRVREWKERVEKEERKKPWVQLPNKPLHGQRPYYSW